MSNKNVKGQTDNNLAQSSTLQALFKYKSGQEQEKRIDLILLCLSIFFIIIGSVTQELIAACAHFAGFIGIGLIAWRRQKSTQSHKIG